MAVTAAVMSRAAPVAASTRSVRRSSRAAVARTPAPAQVPARDAAAAPAPVSLPRAGALAVALALAAQMAFGVGPSEAFKGGGPLGKEVTRGATLTGRDFSGLEIPGSDFKTSILRQAKMRGTNCDGCSFFDSDLTDMDMEGASMRGADFSLAGVRSANCNGVDFTEASVTGNTSFAGSTIVGADFTDVLFRDDTRKELCAVASGTHKNGNATRDTLLCD